MMEPLTALSLSCNVLDLTGKAIKCGIAIKKLRDGVSNEDHDELERLAETMDTVVVGLQSQQTAPDMSRSDSAHRMRSIVSKLSAQCQTLRDLIQKCKPAKGGSWRSASVAVIQTLLSKRDIDDIRKELDEGQGMLEILIAEESLHRLRIAKTDLDQVGLKTSQIANSLDDLRMSLTTGNQDIRTQLSQVMDAIKEADDTKKHRLILRALAFSSMDARFREVQEAEVDTFRWILEDPDIIRSTQPQLHIDFTDWLRFGSGIFHVVGKPGAGKSTLLKFLCEDYQTEDLLQEWAVSAGKRLVFCKFFFWRITAIGEQKSLKGLVRSLLHDILVEVPTLAATLFPRQWDRRLRISRGDGIPKAEITDREIMAAFDSLVGNPRIAEEENLRMCFFVDGLDEFEQNIKLQRETYSDLATKLQTWADASRGDIKMCVSSRPLPEFQIFPASQRIILQLSTEGDIRNLITHQLECNSRFRELRVQSTPTARRCDTMVQYIVSEANGVFLWVVLIINQLKQALASGDSITVLEKIVTSSNKDLNEFFSGIMHSIPEHHRVTSWYLLAGMLMMAGIPISNTHSQCSFTSREWGRKRVQTDNVHNLTLEDCSNLFERVDYSNRHLIDCAEEAATWLPSESYHNATRQAQVEQYLDSRCRGLVGVNARQGVIFTHRAIPEALQSFFEGLDTREALDHRKVAEMLTWMILTCIRRRPKPGTNWTRRPMTIWNRVEYLIGCLSLCDLRQGDDVFKLLHQIDSALLLHDSSRHITKFFSWDPALQGPKESHDWQVLWPCQSNGLYGYVVWALDNTLSFPTDQNTIFTLLSDITAQQDQPRDPIIEWRNQQITNKMIERGVTLRTEIGCNIWYRFVAQELLFRATAQHPRWTSEVAGRKVNWSGLTTMLQLGADPEIYLSRKGNKGRITGLDRRILYQFRSQYIRPVGEDQIIGCSPVSLKELIKRCDPLNANELLVLIERNSVHSNVNVEQLLL